MSSESLMTVTDYARFMMLDPQTVYRKIHRGELQVLRVGRTIRIVAPKFLQPDSSGQETERTIKVLPHYLQKLFWDVDFSLLKADDAIVTERILEQGDFAAVKWLLQSFNKSELIKFVKMKGLKRLSPRSINFWNLFLGISDDA